MTGGAPHRSGPPPAGPHPTIVFPEVEKTRVSCGLDLDVVRTMSAPDVAVRLVVEAGAARHGPERAGLAALTAELLAEGARGRPAPEMARWLDGIGASFSARPTFDAMTLSMHAMADQLDAALEFLAAVACAPDFDEVEVDRRRAMRIDRLRRRHDELAVVAAESLDAAVYGLHPYGRPLAGTEDTIAELGRADVAQFWALNANPSTARLVIAGSLDPAEASEAADRAFEGWPENAGAGGTGGTREGERPTVPVPTDAVRAGEVLFIDRPASRQSEIRIGCVGIDRGHPDEIPVLVMNAVLGGVFNSRLNLNLREDKGWTYGARSSFDRRRMPGPFRIRTAVDTAVTDRAIEEILGEVAGMRAAAPTDEEIELAVNALTLSLPLQFETTSQLAGRRAQSVIYGLPDDYWDTYAERVRAVQPGDALAAARRHLDPAALVVVAAGAVGEFSS